MGKVMHTLETSSRELRRKRTRSLIMLGGLVEKAGLLETFSLPLGEDFQKNSNLKNKVAVLFKGLLMLNKMANSEELFHKDLWAQEGLQKLREMKRKK